MPVGGPRGFEHITREFGGDFVLFAFAGEMEKGKLRDDEFLNILWAINYSWNYEHNLEDESEDESLWAEGYMQIL